MDKTQTLLDTINKLSPRMTDKEIRLECLKIASQSYRPIPNNRGFGESIYEYNIRVPQNTTQLANKYFNYLETGIPIETDPEE